MYFYNSKVMCFRINKNDNYHERGNGGRGKLGSGKWEVGS